MSGSPTLGVVREHGTRGRYRFGLTVQSRAAGCRCGPCCEANDLYDRYEAMRLPVQPAVDAIVASGVTVKAFELSTGLNLYRCIRAGSLTVTMADRVAVALGLHPFKVWGADWLSDETPIELACSA